MNAGLMQVEGLASQDLQGESKMTADRTQGDTAGLPQDIRRIELLDDSNSCCLD